MGVAQGEKLVADTATAEKKVTDAMAKVTASNTIFQQRIDISHKTNDHAFRSLSTKITSKSFANSRQYEPQSSKQANPTKCS